METIIAHLIFFAACFVIAGLLFQFVMLATLFVGMGDLLGDLPSFPAAQVVRTLGRAFAKSPQVFVLVALFYLGILGAAIKIASLCWPLL
jgi:hypothetical protein